MEIGNTEYDNSILSQWMWKAVDRAYDLLKPGLSSAKTGSVILLNFYKFFHWKLLVKICLHNYDFTCLNKPVD